MLREDRENHTVSGKIQGNIREFCFVISVGTLLKCNNLLFDAIDMIFQLILSIHIKYTMRWLKRVWLRIPTESRPK